MRAAAVADGDALEARALEHALDQPQDLLVVVDDKGDVAMDERGVRPVAGRAGPSRDRHGATCPCRGSCSVSAMARAAAVRTSWTSALTASGLPDTQEGRPAAERAIALTEQLPRHGQVAP